MSEWVHWAGFWMVSFSGRWNQKNYLQRKYNKVYFLPFLFLPLFLLLLLLCRPYGTSSSQTGMAGTRGWMLGRRPSSWWLWWGMRRGWNRYDMVPVFCWFGFVQNVCLLLFSQTHYVWSWTSVRHQIHYVWSWTSVWHQTQYVWSWTADRKTQGGGRCLTSYTFILVLYISQFMSGHWHQTHYVWSWTSDTLCLVLDFCLTPDTLCLVLDFCLTPDTLCMVLDIRYIMSCLL